MGNEQTTYNGRLDKAGVIASWVCLAHCLGLPLLLAAVPVSAAYFLESEAAEWAILAATAAIGLAALVPPYFRHHRKLTSLMLFASGFALLVSADAAFEDNLADRAAVLVFGAAGITAAHLLNRHHCRKCAACSGTEGCSTE